MSSNLIAFSFVAGSAAVGGLLAWFAWTWLVEGARQNAKCKMQNAPAMAAFDETSFCAKCGCGMEGCALGWRCPECGHLEEAE